MPLTLRKLAVFSACILLVQALNLSIPLVNGCGSIEFDINFMKPAIVIYDA
jgi:acid phosphatase family membrane protein YuiD